MASGRRKTPSVSVMRRDLGRNSRRPNSYFAKKWGVSRERVRQLRAQLGFPASSVIQTAVQTEMKATRAADRAKLEATLSDRFCPVCDSPVPVLRRTTCSTGCATLYRGNSRYRYQKVTNGKELGRK